MSVLRRRSVDEGRGQTGSEIWATWCQDMYVALQKSLPQEGYVFPRGPVVSSQPKKPGDVED